MADIFLNGGSATILRDIFMFQTPTVKFWGVFDAIEPVDEWQPSRKVIEIIEDLQREGRL